MKNRWEIITPHYNGITLRDGKSDRNEQFVKIEGTTRFYISTYGRIAVKNENGKFDMIERCERCNIEFIGETRCRMVFIDKIVANEFLIKVPGRNCVWHKDRNRYNNDYRNLIYVTKTDYIRLLLREVNFDQLGYIQYYYPIWAFNPRIQNQKYNDMVRRCNTKKNYGVVCEEWLHDKNTFFHWMEDSSYPDIGFNYEIDKDIMVPGSKLYSPETCCFVPKKINLLFETPNTNIKETVKDDCKKYYFVKPGTTNDIKYYLTEEEARQEYIRYKANLIRGRAVKYRYAVTDEIYHAMLNYACVVDKILTWE